MEESMKNASDAQLAVDDDVLAYLDVHTHAGDQFCVVTKYSLFHAEFLLVNFWNLPA